MKDIKLIYKNENVIIDISEDGDLYFYALKDCEELHCALKIKVFKNNNGKKGEYIGIYKKQWQEEVNLNSINSFIKNFLENPLFREEYLSDGIGFSEIVKYSNEKGINTKCAEAINRFYKKNKSKRKFKDYANLKTYGIDKYSRLKFEKAKELVEDKVVKEIEIVFTEEKDINNTLKWYLRGLKIEDAIRKVKTDLEIANNIKR